MSLPYWTGPLVASFALVAPFWPFLYRACQRWAGEDW
jgi:hypothetical protein